MLSLMILICVMILIIS